jgi:predicted transcriptional regulator of viral defense system
MRFREFESQVKHLPAFNLNDVRKFDPSFYRQQFNTWQKLGSIKPLVGGYYILADQALGEDSLFMLANLLYQPSYISLESALSFHHIIPESVLGITSISSRKTRQFESEWGMFSYRSVKPAYMFGYQVIEGSRGQKIKIATLEKAVLDTLYLNSGIQSIADFEGLRWNKANLQSLKGNVLFQKYLAIFDKKALERRVACFMEYLNA